MIERLKGMDRMDVVTIVLCIAVFVIAAYSLATTPMEWDFILDIISYAALIAAPILVLVNPRKTLQTSAGIFALAVSVYNITLSVLYFEQENDIIYFAMGAMYAVLGLAMAVSALLYIRGASRNVSVMIYAAACSIAIEVFFFALSLHWGISLLVLLSAYSNTTLVTIVANVAIVTLLSTEGIRRYTMEWRMEAAVSDTKTILGIDPSSFVYREDMERVLAWFADAEGCSDGTVYSDRNVVSEICVPVIYPKVRTYDLAFQRYADGRIMIVVFDDNGSFAKGSTICVNTAVPDKDAGYDRVRFYGEDGMFVNILVDDPEPKRRWSILRKTD